MSLESAWNRDSKTRDSEAITLKWITQKIRKQEENMRYNGSATIVENPWRSHLRT